MKSIFITGNNLTFQDFENICYRNQPVRLHPKAKKNVEKNLALLESWKKENKKIYGLNTGFGILSDKQISNTQTQELQENLIRSHSCGVGPLFSKPEVRGILLLRAHVLASGYSGVRPKVIELLLHCLNKNILPVIPQKGSVGASGDLAPLAHLALALIGEGEVFYKDHRMPSQKAFQKEKIKPLTLQGREGLALINGTQVMTAVGLLNLFQAKKLSYLFDVAAALSLDACFGSRKAYLPRVHQLRPHVGQIETAKNIYQLTQNSPIQAAHKNCGRVQDAYSFRCVPQVHGSIKDTLHYVEKILKTEMNSVTDNPLFFTKEKMWVSAGHFHGQYLGHAMDYLSIAFTTLCHISERRIEKLFDPQFSGLPTCLSPNEGLNSGLMLAHVTAAALTSENKVLSHPASVDTIPTSGNKEDHVSMGTHAALKAKEILENTKNILAIEFLSATQGIFYRRPLKTSPVLESVIKIIRKKVPPITKDRVFSKDIEAIKLLLDEIYDAT
ncbi:MAG: histidine ammonia-lyase [Deltaproteobacteria bacterium RIFCSPHIGHO2_02_FULL_40_11]|nr:MAG: histidine ammonia-lyase [Deltaproteobacteria bacterium RIFCSPHIGHO2_02_FULL_40_11]